MRLNVFLLSAVFVLAFSSFSFAGPAFPCPTAVNSAHGNALAIVHDTIEWHTNTGKVLSVQFTVMTKATFLNAYQRISAPVTYWGDWPWAVILDMNNQTDRSFSMSCAVPLITDDGHFLILLAVGPAFNAALRIYKRGEDDDRMQDGTVKGVLVREITLKELWPAAKIDPNHLWTDHTPEWFAGGTFDFAPDNLQLIHKTRWGNTIRINLPDGTVWKD
jgi:hypothetical protein